MQAIYCHIVLIGADRQKERKAIRSDRIQLMMMVVASGSNNSPIILVIRISVVVFPHPTTTKAKAYFLDENLKEVKLFVSH